MNTVRWGLLSTANINRRLIPAIHASARGRLAAVASRDLARARSYAAEWEIPVAYGSYEAMLASDEIDAVYISLPNHLHVEWTLHAMDAGKHVLCEKPFALSLDAFDQVIARAAATGVKVAEAFMYRHHPQTKVVGEWVQSGRLGDVVLFRGHFSFVLANPANVRMVPEWGGGSLWDVGVYPLSFAQYIMGETPQWVMGDQWLGDTGVDESFCGHLHYPDGRMAQISSGFRMGFHTTAEIMGTEGRLLLTRPFVSPQDGEVRFYPADGAAEAVPVPAKDLYLGEVEDMHAAILDGSPNYLTLAETRNHIRTVLALYESARQGQPVELSSL
jgi:D-xylose 1-dehydrogenase (NADP+, D-xylono-1,5-lactone-forming)